MKSLFNVLGALCCAVLVFMVLASFVADRGGLNAEVIGVFGGGALTCFFCAAILDRLDQIIVRLGLLPAATPKALAEKQAAPAEPVEAPVSKTAKEYEETVRAMRESLRTDPDIAAHIARKQAQRE